MTREDEGIIVMDGDCVFGESGDTVTVTQCSDGDEGVLGEARDDMGKSRSNGNGWEVEGALL